MEQDTNQRKILILRNREKRGIELKTDNTLTDTELKSVFALGFKWNKSTNLFWIKKKKGVLKALTEYLRNQNIDYEIIEKGEYKPVIINDLKNDLIELIDDDINADYISKIDLMIVLGKNHIVINPKWTIK